MHCNLTILKQALKTLDDRPGVYRMVNEKGRVLYIGKARKLKKRFANYIHFNKLPTRLQRMISETKQVFFIVTKNEEEALLLEAQLIKEMKPKYNVLLRDDKSLPFIQIHNDDFPAINICRGNQKPGDTLFGPFSSTSHVRQTIDSLTKVFLLRTCSNHVFKKRIRPCLQHQIKRCTAPCVQLITKEDYLQNVKRAIDFLQGKKINLSQKLTQEMESAACVLNFEQAARIRDQIHALHKIQTHQLIHVPNINYADVIALARHKNQICIQVFFIRGHHMCGNVPFFFQEELPDPTLLYTFLIQFYQNNHIPKKILISHDTENHKILEKALKTNISIPKKSDALSLIQYGIDNALYALQTHGINGFSMLETFLQKKIKRIEVYDNSHTFSKYSIGAMIVVTETGFQKRLYRIWNIQKTPGNDCGMIHEVLERRLQSIKDYPEVMVIDGGPGQLSSAYSVLQNMKNIPHIQLIAIAKGKKRNAGQETLYFLDKQPIKLPSNDPLLYFLQRIRDEAHRFAISAHRKKRDQIRSPLQSIPGLGPKRKQALLNHFESLGAVLTAPTHELIKVPGISKKMAQDIYNYSCCLSNLTLE